METSITQRLLGTGDALALFDPQALTFLVLSIVILWIGKCINDFTTPYNLSEQLTEKDNKAIAVSFAGYMLAIGVIVWGVLRQDIAATGVEDGRKLLWMDIGSTALWSVFGILLLQVARVANDKLLLRRFCNVKELVEDHNVGTGAVQAGSYVGSAFVIQAATHGEGSGSLIADIGSTLLYFACCQIAFIVFGLVYQRISAYDLHDEIERDNAAAGVWFGMTLAAIGMLLSSYLISSDSLIGLGVWFAICVCLLSICRYAVDKFILPGSLLDEEISRDRNWGAALIEGTAAIGLALILTTLFH